MLSGAVPSLIVFISVSLTASMTDISSVPTFPTKTNFFFCKIVMPSGATPTFNVFNVFNVSKSIMETVLSPWFVM